MKTEKEIKDAIKTLPKHVTGNDSSRDQFIMSWFLALTWVMEVGSYKDMSIENVIEKMDKDCLEAIERN